MPRQLHVFIVDDDEGSRRSVEALVEPMQVTIHSFESAESFLKAYANERPACLITDQRMPGVSGIQMLEQLRSRGLQLSVLVMTAYPDTRSTVRAMVAGAMTLIEKPCNPQELWDAIQEGLRSDEVRYQQETQKRDATARIASLSSGEFEVLELLSEGKANKVIASRLGVSLRTVEARRSTIFEKLGVESVAAMMKLWLLTRVE